MPASSAHHACARGVKLGGVSKALRAQVGDYNAFLRKPFDIDALVRAVRSLLGTPA